MPDPPLPTRRTNEERSATTRTRLLDATIDCLVELGWARTTTTEVARRAGVSRGAQVHHYPTKDDLVLAAVEHLLERRNQEFRHAFASLPPDQRSPGVAMRLLRDTCFVDSFDARLELIVAARTEPALHARFIELEARFFENSLDTFRSMFPEATSDPELARAALSLTFSILDGQALDRILGGSQRDRDAVLDVFDFLIAPYFPDPSGGPA